VDTVVDGTPLRIVGTVSPLAIDGRYKVFRAEQVAVPEAALVK